jgi:hypothetical protein
VSKKMNVAEPAIGSHEKNATRKSHVMASDGSAQPGYYQNQSCAYFGCSRGTRAVGIWRTSISETMVLEGMTAISYRGNSIRRLPAIGLFLINK